MPKSAPDPPTLAVPSDPTDHPTATPEASAYVSEHGLAVANRLNATKRPGGTGGSVDRPNR